MYRRNSKSKYHKLVRKRHPRLRDVERNGYSPSRSSSGVRYPEDEIESQSYIRRQRSSSPKSSPGSESRFLIQGRMCHSPKDDADIDISGSNRSLNQTADSTSEVTNKFHYSRRVLVDPNRARPERDRLHERRPVEAARYGTLRERVGKDEEHHHRQTTRGHERARERRIPRTSRNFNMTHPLSPDRLSNPREDFCERTHYHSRVEKVWDPAMSQSTSSHARERDHVEEEMFDTNVSSTDFQRESDRDEEVERGARSFKTVYVEDDDTDPKWHVGPDNRNYIRSMINNCKGLHRRVDSPSRRWDVPKDNKNYIRSQINHNLGLRLKMKPKHAKTTVEYGKERSTTTKGRQYEKEHRDKDFKKRGHHKHKELKKVDHHQPDSGRSKPFSKGRRDDGRRKVHRVYEEQWSSSCEEYETSGEGTRRIETTKKITKETVTDSYDESKERLISPSEKVKDDRKPILSRVPKKSAISEGKTSGIGQTKVRATKASEKINKEIGSKSVGKSKTKKVRDIDVLRSGVQKVHLPACNRGFGTKPYGTQLDTEDERERCWCENQDSWEKTGYRVVRVEDEEIPSSGTPIYISELRVNLAQPTTIITSTSSSSEDSAHSSTTEIETYRSSKSSKVPNADDGSSTLFPSHPESQQKTKAVETKKARNGQDLEELSTVVPDVSSAKSSGRFSVPGTSTSTEKRIASPTVDISTSKIRDKGTAKMSDKEDKGTARVSIKEDKGTAKLSDKEDKGTARVSVKEDKGTARVSNKEDKGIASTSSSVVEKSVTMKVEKEQESKDQADVKDREDETNSKSVWGKFSSFFG